MMNISNMFNPSMRQGCDCFVVSRSRGFTSGYYIVEPLHTSRLCLSKNTLSIINALKYLEKNFEQKI